MRPKVEFQTLLVELNEDLEALRCRDNLLLNVITKEEPLQINSALCVKGNQNHLEADAVFPSAADGQRCVQSVTRLPV